MNTANMISRPNGSVQVRCAPKPELYQAASRSSTRNSRPMPRLIRIEGTIRLAMAR